MKGTVWLTLVALAILVALACRLPGSTPPGGAQTAIAGLGDEADEEELLDDFIVLTPRPTPASSFFFSAATYFVNEADRLATITVLLDPPVPDQSVTVLYNTSDGTAISPADYTATSGTLTFNPGQTSQNFIVPVILDSINEITETVSLTLSSPVGAVLGQPNPAVLVILDSGTATGGPPLPVDTLPGELPPTAVTLTPPPTATPRRPTPPPDDEPNPTSAPTVPPATVPPTAIPPTSAPPTNPPPTQPPAPTDTPTPVGGGGGGGATDTPTPTVPPVLVVNTADDTNDGSCSTIHCSLREAINLANVAAGAHTVTIQFNIPGAGVQTIRPNSSLPLVTSPVVIDATTQPGASCGSWPPTLLIEVDGSNAGAGANGLHIVAGNSTVTGFVLNRFSGNGLVLDGSGTNRVVCNFVGTNVSGAAALSNGVGIFVFGGSSGNTIGGSTPGERNLISGNFFQGVRLADAATTGNVVQGNYIGTDVTGLVDLGNGAGITSPGVIVVNAPNNTIGGAAANTGNVISGNSGAGVHILGAAATGNTVRANLIGTNTAGTARLGNSQQGVIIGGGASGNIVGGLSTGERNVISGNEFQGVGILDSTTTGNFVQGNYIGTDVSGTADLGNGDVTGSAGVIVEDAPNNTIGGAVAGAGNLISGNGSAGVRVADASGTVVQGNWIGTNGSGTATIGNAASGVLIDGVASNATIGGNVAQARNIISGNGLDGVRLSGAGVTGIFVQGNYIGTDINGTVDLGNAQQGVLIDTSAGNIIGGNTAGTRNLISGNNQNGILLLNAGTTNNQIQGNYIGTDVSGTLNLRNSLRGVRLGAGTTNNTIGGNTAGAGNRIAFNGGGVRNDGNVLTLAFNTVINNGAIDGGGVYNVGRLTVLTSTIGTNTATTAGAGIWNSGVITLTDSSLVNNSAPGGAEANDGGGLYNHSGASALLTNVTIQGNQATDGAGIFNTGGSNLQLNNSQIIGNTASKNAGGLENDGGSIALVSSSGVLSNTADQVGGGIYNLEPTSRLTVIDTTVSFNSTINSSGGGISNLNGEVIISDSAINRNSALADAGGGLWQNEDAGAATMTITNTTISNNSAATAGGGLFNQSAGGGAVVSLAHSTVSSNTVAVVGAGGGVRADSGTINVTHTILANSGTGGDCSIGTGIITSLGYNIESDGTCPFGAIGDIPSTNPLLLPLQNNGGNTDTHALQAVSPAVNAGDPTFTPPPDFDQRGTTFPRVQNGLIDIGAYESPF